MAGLLPSCFGSYDCRVVAQAAKGSPMIPVRIRRFARAVAALLAGFGAASSDCRAQPLEKISIVIFSAPSLGAFMPPVIKARKLDAANGLDIAFHERTPDAYAAQFNSGEFKVGGSAALLTVGLADSRGVKAQYLFNLFDYWGAVVTSHPEIRTLKDLEGRQLAGARATTNYMMFEFFAKRLGVDVAKIAVVNTATPGLVGYALANRADAVQIWEPGYTLLLAKKPDIRTLDPMIEATWKSFAGGSRIPYLGVGAHADWAAAHPVLVAKLYATYKAAADWITSNPDQAAPLVVPGASADDVKAMASLIRSNQRLAMSLVPANDIRNEIEAVYKAGIDVGYFPALPSSGTVYGKALP
jgi:NitT/TauT family transport system substrate-binding protein